MTKISVVIPALNEEEYLPDLLNSISDQNFTQHEVVVCDGGSTDNTKDIAENFGAKVVKGGGNGPGAARNKGAKNADGEILLFMDSDTKLANNTVFEDIIKAVEEDDVAAGTSSWKVHDANLKSKLGYKTSSNIIYIMNKLGFPAAAGTFLFTRKKLFQNVGGFDGDLPFHEDHDLYKKLSKKGNTICMSKTHSTSGRRIVENGLFHTMKTYLIPSFYYMIGMDGKMKEKFEFKKANR